MKLWHPCTKAKHTPQCANTMRYGGPAFIRGRNWFARNPCDTKPRANQPCIAKPLTIRRVTA